MLGGRLDVAVDPRNTAQSLKNPRLVVSLSVVGDLAKADLPDLAATRDSGKSLAPASDLQAAAPPRQTGPVQNFAPIEPAGLIPLLPLEASRYFGPNDLTEKPQVLEDIPADFVVVVPAEDPDSARVQIYINALGEIDKVEIEDAPLSEQGERIVQDAVRKIKFSPGKIGDLPVKSMLRIEISFEKAITVPDSTSILSVTPVQ